MRNLNKLKEFEIVFEVANRRFVRIIKDESLKAAEGQAKILFSNVKSVNPIRKAATI
jgi:hypothetical protein